MLKLCHLPLLKSRFRVRSSVKSFTQILSPLQSKTDFRTTSPHHTDESVELRHLTPSDVLMLLNNLGFSLNSKHTLDGIDLLNLETKSDLENIIDSEVPVVKFKALVKCIDAFKIIGVPNYMLKVRPVERIGLVVQQQDNTLLNSTTQMEDTTSFVQSEKCDYTKVQYLYGHKSQISHISMMSANQLVTSSADGTLRIWNADTGKCDQVWDDKKYGEHLGVLSDGRIVNVCSDFYEDDSYHMNIYDPMTKLCVQTLNGHTDHISTMLVLHDNTVVSGSYDNTIRLWNPDTGECLKVFKLEGNGDVSPRVMCAVSNDILASCAWNKTIEIWNMNTGKRMKVLEGHTALMRCLCKLPDGRLASGGHDHTIRIWNVETGACDVVLNEASPILSLAVLPDGRLVSGVRNNTVQVWNVSTGTSENVFNIGTFGYTVDNLLVLKDGRIVFNVGNFLHVLG